ncbi:MAG: F0F1 ATP synthase subunit A [Deltaproteobacteria bacterium]|nr:F0F1 ATP synthase subunit A [Deltaproteobacteria bacterium]
MEEFTWFGWISDKVTHHNIHIFSALLAAALLVFCSLIYRRSFQSVDAELVPTDRVSLKNIFQVAVENILGLIEGIIGHDAKLYLPLIGTLFIYIFVNNLLGIIPGFTPATENVNTNFAMSITVFLYYNYVGIKKQGIKNYLKHFMGPLWMLAPLMFLIELVSHVVRPVSLAVRLFGNITGDHVVLGIFSELVPLIVPVIFFALGIFVSFIQAFVFSLLSTVYIGLAVAHEEH